MTDEKKTRMRKLRRQLQYLNILDPKRSMEPFHKQMKRLQKLGCFDLIEMKFAIDLMTCALNSLESKRKWNLDEIRAQFEYEKLEKKGLV